MKESTDILSPKEVQIEAKSSWNLELTQFQAKSILNKNAAKIRRAMKDAARELMRQEVADFLFKQEEKELRI